MVKKYSTILEKKNMMKSEAIDKVHLSVISVNCISLFIRQTLVSINLWPYVYGILQERILEWAAFPFSRGSSQPGIEPRSPALQADSLLSEPPGNPIIIIVVIFKINYFIYGLGQPRV